MEPSTLHADVDAFFASVEQRDAPELLGKPVIVGAGVVMAASYEARAFGIRGGMGGAEARSRCPDAIVVPPRFSAYVEASRALFEVFRDTAPRVDGRSLEEAFLDVSGLERIAGHPSEIARGLRERVRSELGLPLSVGIARTRVLAKMASRAAKPDGLLLVPADGERAFLHPLPVERIWGVGPATAARLHDRGIVTVGDIAARSEPSLIAAFGDSTGRWLHALAHFRDPATRRRGRGRRSFGSQSALGRRRRSRRELDQTLCRLVERVTGRMRKAGRSGRTIVLRLRFDDYSRATRSATLPRPTAATETILRPARELLDAAGPTIARRGVTLLGITITNLDIPGVGVQLSLPLDGDEGAALDSALDRLRDQFGSGTVTRGPPGRESAGLVDVSR
jgi:DNA polymerase-4